MDREKNIDKLFHRKANIGMYISTYSELYLEEMAKEKGIGMGRALDLLILEREDLNDTLKKRVEKITKEL